MKTARERPRILVVDDEVGFTRLLKLNLERAAGYEVWIENKASRAVAAALELQPDLLLLDLVMPELGGLEVVAALRAHEALRDVPVLFLTAVAAAGQAAAGEPVIVKPVSLTELMARIEDRLRARQGA
ncbi:MAG: response regulator [Planctomycetes bacterium]|nr:response regulator [Planctomycetota bacterium]